MRLAEDVELAPANPRPARGRNRLQDGAVICEQFDRATMCRVYSVRDPERKGTVICPCPDGSESVGSKQGKRSCSGGRESQSRKAGNPAASHASAPAQAGANHHASLPSDLARNDARRGRVWCRNFKVKEFRARPGNAESQAGAPLRDVYDLNIHG